MNLNIKSFLAVLCVCLSCMTGLAQAAERRVALVIGNDHYQKFGALKNARADARAVANKLKALGFEVSLYLDADAKTMLRAMRQFKRQINGGDDVVFYYSGHGVQLEAANYLLPVDIVGENVDQVKDDALALQRVLDDLRDQKARFSLAIIDACRDNPFKGTGRAIGSRGLAPTTAATGQMVLYSAGAGQQALDRLDVRDRNPNGLFTRVLLKEIDKPGLSVDRMLRNVRDEVVRLAKGVGHEQVPALYDQTVGDFYFLRAAAQVNVGAKPIPIQPTQAPIAVLKPGQVFRDCPDCPEMVVLPAGSFDMGSPSYDPERGLSEGPQHPVRLPAFALAKTELMRGQFAAFMQATGYRTRDICRTYEQGVVEMRSTRGWLAPGFQQDDTHPVVCLDKDEVQAYLDWLSKQTGKDYRLPSEAEWEYAARAGTERSRYWEGGPAATCQFANIGDKTTQNQVPGGIQVAHPCSDGFAYTAPVASFKPNAFGLYDMIGNVSEWVEDCWHADYSGAPSDGRAWNSTTCMLGVVRGGSWSDDPPAARAMARRSARISRDVSTFDSEIGLRPALSLP